MRIKYKIKEFSYLQKPKVGMKVKFIYNERNIEEMQKFNIKRTAVDALFKDKILEVTSINNGWPPSHKIPNPLHPYKVSSKKENDFMTVDNWLNVPRQLFIEVKT